jgi:hypothetical protein
MFDAACAYQCLHGAVASAVPVSSVQVHAQVLKVRQELVSLRVGKS